MGINVNGLRFLLYARSKGVDLTRTAMIGRQGLHLKFEQFQGVLQDEFHLDLDAGRLAAIYRERYCDALLRHLGADTVHSFDYSDYEDSTHVHDFNKPIPERFFGGYTAIIEGGTLEHVFDFPTAITNCMRMLQTGGHYLGVSPTNNYMGHGFYQFSPELYFRVFSPENGFQLDRMMLHEGRNAEKWYTVPDPQDVKCRVGVANSTPTLLLILAKKLADGPIFSASPLQSDYVSTWQAISPGVQSSARKRSLQSTLKRHIPRFIKNVAKRILRREQSDIGPLFTPFDPAESISAGRAGAICRAESGSAESSHKPRAKHPSRPLPPC